MFSVLASYAALDLAGRVVASDRQQRFSWLFGGTISMGTGIWGVHYIGMLAFGLPVPVRYHYPTVIFSLLAAVAASAVALFTISRKEMTPTSWVAGSLMMGTAIIAMHFIGMAAMRMSATTQYDLRLLLLAGAWAMAGSLGALRLAFHVREEAGEKNLQRKLLSALIMGGAIALMHYTAMWSAAFRESFVAPDLTNSLSISSLGIATISGVVLTVLLAAIGTSYLDRFVTARMAEVSGAQEGEAFFRNLAEAIPAIVWTANSEGAVDFASDRWYQYSGRNPQENKGLFWENSVHPDDLDVSTAKWRESIRSGEPYEVEYRLRRGSDGAYLWFLARAAAVRDEHGKIIKWFGTCTDIEEQKHHQQTLEGEIRQRTEELADANTRLQEEAWEKDVARRQLDEQHEQMMTELTSRSQRATLLAKMGELLQSCVTKEEVFAAALGFAPKIFPNNRGAVALLNNARSVVEVAGTWLDCEMSSVFEPSSCWALRTAHPHLVVAGDRTAPCTHAAGVNSSYLCIPIMAQGEALGIMHFQATDAAPSISDSDLSFRTTFAGQVGLSVANIRLREALRTQSIKDALTGLYNRRYLEEILEREIRRAIRASGTLGVLILDLDHFKKFNDTYGHDAGDTVLREAASFVTKSIRMEDVACRYGGEEFVVILPTADLKASQMRAERIGSKIRELSVTHQGTPLGRITVSIGVAGLPVHGNTPKALLEAADAALYRAKKEGRDRVVVADAPIPAEVAATAIANSAAN